MKKIFDSTENVGLYGGRDVSDMWLERIDKILNDNNAVRMNALDIGCGGGIYTFALKKLGFNFVTGIDNSRIMMKSAIDSNFDKTVNFKVGDFFDNKLFDLFYDVILSRAVVHHIKNLDKAFTETFRVLKENGIFLIQDRTQEDLDVEPSQKNLRGYLYSFKPSLKEYDKNRRHSEEKVRESLISSGFKEVEVIKINELRKKYETIDELKSDYKSRKGRSILFNLSDNELSNFIDFLESKIERKKNITEADQWTLWIAKK